MKKSIFISLVSFLFSTAIFAAAPADKADAEAQSLMPIELECPFVTGKGLLPVTSLWYQSKGSMLEKNSEIKEELKKDTPDWEKIKTLNDEIAKLHSELRTEMMKTQHKSLQKSLLESTNSKK